MTYDFYGGWSNVTGHQTGLNCGSHFSTDECNGTGLDADGKPRKGPAYTVSNAVDLLLAQGVNPKQIVVGTAMYGRGWEGVTPQNTTIADNPMTAMGSGKLTGSTAQGVWEAGIIDYKGLAQNMVGAAGNGVNGFEVGYDEMADAAYVWNRQSGTLITYDSPRSVIAKGQYVQANGLGGLFAWEIDADNGDILNAMHEGLADGEPVGPTPNKKPVINLANNLSVDSGQTLTINASATDADNQVLTYSWSINSALTANTTDSASIEITVNTVTENTAYTLTLSVSDGEATVSKSTTLTVIAQATDENQAPAVNALPDLTIEELTQANVVVAASDANGDTLTFTWQVPAGLTQVGSGANISLIADEVTADTSYTVSVAVSDGKATTTQSFLLTVTDASTTTPPTDTWDSNTIYTSGDTVVFNGITYQANWWVQGQRPDQSGAWSEVIPDDGIIKAWRADLVYNNGDIVSYQGVNYSAAWWTKGEQPGSAAVWKQQ
jgi:chitinase